MTLIANKRYYTEVAKGNVPGASAVHKFGHNASIGTTLTVVASAAVYPMPTTLTTLEMFSSDNTNDVAGGSGARTVTVFGLSTDWLEVSEVVVLNGTTAVTLANQYFRVYRMYVEDSGTYATVTTPSHNSTITLRVGGAGATWATFGSESSYGLAQTEVAAYTIPAGKTGYLVNKFVSVEGNKNISVFMTVRTAADTVAAPFSAARTKELDRELSGILDKSDEVPELLGAGPTDVFFCAKTNAGTSGVSIEFDILLIDD